MDALFVSKKIGMLTDLTLRHDPFYEKIKNLETSTDLDFTDPDAVLYKKKFDRIYRENKGPVMMTLFGYHALASNDKTKHFIHQGSTLSIFTDNYNSAVDLAKAKSEDTPKLIACFTSHCVVKVLVPYSRIYFHYGFSLDKNYRDERKVTVFAHGLTFKVVNRFPKAIT